MPSTQKSESPSIERLVRQGSINAPNAISPTGVKVFYLEAKCIFADLPDDFIDIDEFITAESRDISVASQLIEARKSMGELLAKTHITLAQLRLSAGLSQSDLAEKLGNSQSGYSMIESGKREPSFRTQEKLVSILGVSRDLLAQAINNTLEKVSNEH